MVHGQRYSEQTYVMFGSYYNTGKGRGMGGCRRDFHKSNGVLLHVRVIVIQKTTENQRSVVTQSPTNFQYILTFWEWIFV